MNTEESSLGYLGGGRWPLCPLARRSGDTHNVGQGLGSQPLHDMSPMGLYRTRADADLSPDLLVCLAGQDASQDLLLPHRHLGNPCLGPASLVGVLLSLTNVSRG
jgi:hypothetical protein